MNTLSFQLLRIPASLRVFKRLGIVTNTTSVLIYLFVRVMVADYNFDPVSELVTLFKIALIGTAAALVLYLGYSLTVFCEKKMEQKKSSRSPLKLLALAVICLSASIAGNAQSITGIKKDAATGLTANYKDIEPEEALLVMNGEVLGHTDIPLGESFILINKGVTGFQEKNGKVSIGCSLLITDMQGRVILRNADLFRTKGLYEKKDLNYLKCIINTGRPMSWDRKYRIEVVFWDKFGTGKITNKVIVHMIDLP